MAVNPGPTFDPELDAVVSSMPQVAEWGPDVLTAIRSMPQPTIEDTLKSWPISHEQRTIQGPESDLIVSILRPTTGEAPAKGRPVVLNFHGGGMVMGTRFLGIEFALPWIKELGAVVVTVEYRLAPEHPDPAPVEDCYATLLWTSAHAAELGIDLDRVMVAGGSAGGGLAAGVALLSRDRGGPKLKAQLLIYPMLDDRQITTSARQYPTGGTWNGGSSTFGWGALLGEQVAGPEGKVSIYAAPARAVDLSGVPTAYIDVSSTEVFRDEDVAYATRLWAHGVQAELHVWPGGFHGFDMLVPNATLSKVAIATRNAWVFRTL